MRHLVIIGNGFDLAHGLRTSYKDFIKYIFDNVKDNPTEYKSLIDNYAYWMNYDKAISSIKDINIHVKFNNSLFEIFFRKSTTENWSDVEELYFEELRSICKNYFGTEDERLTKLNNEFADIINHLEKYLSHIVDNNTISPISSLTDLFNKTSGNQSLVLNFNYSNTISKYIKNNDIQQLNLHGQIKDSKNPIIFGYAANQIELEPLLNSGQKEFTKYIKRYHYKNTNNEKLLRNFLDLTGEINVTILGHSCGISDSLILQQIFNNPKVISIRILYFENRKEYQTKCFNIDRIIKNEQLFHRKICDFTESHRMPQLNDSQSQYNDFNSFIETYFKERMPYIFH